MTGDGEGPALDGGGLRSGEDPTDRETLALGSQDGVGPIEDETAPDPGREGGRNGAAPAGQVDVLIPQASLETDRITPGRWGREPVPEPCSHPFSGQRPSGQRPR